MKYVTPTVPDLDSVHVDLHSRKAGLGYLHFGCDELEIIQLFAKDDVRFGPDTGKPVPAWEMGTGWGLVGKFAASGTLVVEARTPTPEKKVTFQSQSEAGAGRRTGAVMVLGIPGICRDGRSCLAGKPQKRKKGSQHDATRLDFHAQRLGADQLAVPCICFSGNWMVVQRVLEKDD